MSHSWFEVLLDFLSSERTLDLEGCVDLMPTHQESVEDPHVVKKLFSGALIGTLQSSKTQAYLFLVIDADHDLVLISMLLRPPFTFLPVLFALPFLVCLSPNQHNKPIFVSRAGVTCSRSWFRTRLNFYALPLSYELYLSLQSGALDDIDRMKIIENNIIISLAAEHIKSVSNFSTRMAVSSRWNISFLNTFVPFQSISLILNS
jgi:hypothetical protein